MPQKASVEVPLPLKMRRVEAVPLPLKKAMPGALLEPKLVAVELRRRKELAEAAHSLPLVAVPLQPRALAGVLRRPRVSAALARSPWTNLAAGEAQTWKAVEPLPCLVVEAEPCHSWGRWVPPGQAMSSA